MGELTNSVGDIPFAPFCRAASSSRLARILDGDAGDVGVVFALFAAPPRRARVVLATRLFPRRPSPSSPTSRAPSSTDSLVLVPTRLRPRVGVPAPAPARGDVVGVPLFFPLLLAFIFCINALNRFFAPLSVLPPTVFAIAVHLFPNSSCARSNASSSSAVHSCSLSAVVRCPVYRRRHCFAVLFPSFCAKSFHRRAPCRSMSARNRSSSSGVHMMDACVGIPLLSTSSSTGRMASRWRRIRVEFEFEFEFEDGSEERRPRGDSMRFDAMRCALSRGALSLDASRRRRMRTRRAFDDDDDDGTGRDGTGRDGTGRRDVSRQGGCVIV